MKKSKYSDSQIMAILKQAEAGSPVPELCRENGAVNFIANKVHAGFFSRLCCKHEVD